MFAQTTEFSVFDAEMMARALNLARKGQYSSTPNPHVGCVIVNQACEIVGEGFTQPAGKEHAEIIALKKAGVSSRDSTVYVTLEPCAHYGKTPPCALALIEARVRKVVIACTDPNPSVNGSGIEMLKAAGVQVSIGLMQNSALTLNEAFFTRIKYKRPFIIVKLAASIDGKTALENGESQWITSVQARIDVQKHRASACAILSGADTVIADNPKLNVRSYELSESTAKQFLLRGKQPLRVLIDSQNRLTQKKYQLFNDTHASLVYNLVENRNLRSEEFSYVSQQQLSGIKLGAREYVNLRLVMEDLASKGINMLWVEAGERLTGALFDLGLVDRLVLYQAPKILGSSGKGLTHITAKSCLSEVLTGDVISMSKIGPDMKSIIQFSHLNKTGN